MSSVTSTSFIGNQWYPIIEAREVPSKRPLSLTRLGRRLVLWRGQGGEVRVHDAACPHRGANLGLGKIDASRGCLVCPYHGFAFGEDGACVGMPCEGSGATIRRDMRLSMFPVREAHGLVWMWYGDGEPDEELPWFSDRIQDGDRSQATTTFEWEVSFSRLIEGMLDLHHLPFAHGKYMGGVGARLDPYVASIEEGGKIIRSKGTLRHEHASPEKGFSGELDLYFPGTLYLQLGGSIFGTVCMCPVSETRSWGYISYHQTICTWPLVSRWLTRLLLWGEMRFIQVDDERMLLSTEPQEVEGVRDNKLVHADLAIALWYRLRAQALER